ncbi:MAG: hypothetical protein KDC84_08740 [Crocinitomicaceae bacterium]|nr:hypothetical protein [Crocinitomicaceae bacterium]
MLLFITLASSQEKKIKSIYSYTYVGYYDHKDSTVESYLGEEYDFMQPPTKKEFDRKGNLIKLYKYPASLHSKPHFSYTYNKTGKVVDWEIYDQSVIPNNWFKHVYDDEERLVHKSFGDSVSGRHTDVLYSYNVNGADTLIKIMQDDTLLYYESFFNYEKVIENRPVKVREYVRFSMTGEDTTIIGEACFKDYYRFGKKVVRINITNETGEYYEYYSSGASAGRLKSSTCLVNGKKCDWSTSFYYHYNAEGDIIFQAAVQPYEDRGIGDITVNIIEYY